MTEPPAEKRTPTPRKAEPAPAPCTVVILDTLTGRRVEDSRFDAAWWAWGNGACDCNRYLAHGLPWDRGRCAGSRRFLVVACSAPGWTLRRLNERYPARLLEEFFPAEGKGGDPCPND